MDNNTLKNKKHEIKNNCKVYPNQLKRLIESITLD